MAFAPVSLIVPAPAREIYEPTATFSHEASVGKIGTEELTYLRSRVVSNWGRSLSEPLDHRRQLLKE